MNRCCALHTAEGTVFDIVQRPTAILHRVVITHRQHLMKRFALLLFVCIGLFASCKKSGGGDNVTPVDPRNQFVGTYPVSGNIRFEINGGAFTPLTTSGTITVSKPSSASAAANQILLTVDFPDLKDQFNAELTGYHYVVTDKKTETFTIFNDAFTGPLNISGDFTDKSEITFASSAEAAGNFTAVKKRTAVGTKK